METIEIKGLEKSIELIINGDSTILPASLYAVSQGNNSLMIMSDSPTTEKIQINDVTKLTVDNVSFTNAKEAAIAINKLANFLKGGSIGNDGVVSPDIADNLTTDDATKVLSARMGKVLDGKISQIQLPIHYKGQVANITNLLLTGNQNGDYYYVFDLGTAYENHEGSATWNGTGWDIAPDKYLTPDRETILVDPTDGKIKVDQNKFMTTKTVTKEEYNAFISDPNSMETAVRYVCNEEESGGNNFSEIAIASGEENLSGKGTIENPLMFAGTANTISFGSGLTIKGKFEAEIEERGLEDARTLSEAKAYVDDIASRGNVENFDPSMTISSSNYEQSKAYIIGNGVNKDFRGYIAKVNIPANTPFNPTQWQLEADDFALNAEYSPWGGDSGRGFIVVNGYGWFCDKVTTLTQANVNSLIAAAFSVTFPMKVGDWRILYGWPDKGSYQVYFYSDNTIRWVDPRKSLGVVNSVIKDSSAPVTSGGVFNFLEAPMTTAEGIIAAQNTRMEALLAQVAELVNDPSKFIHPVGFILQTTDNRNPSTYLLYGTWERFAQGKVLVGLNESETEFNTVNKTGGAKTHKLSESEMPSHAHVQTHHWAALGTADVSAGQGSGSSGAWSTNAAGTRTGPLLLTKTAGSGAAHNNLQPYVTVYMWRRIN